MHKKNKFKQVLQVILLLMLLILISSCTKSELIKVEAVIHRYVDEEAGCVCWTYLIEGGGGITCLPLSDTNLNK
jgi:hypothetical protein